MGRSPIIFCDFDGTITVKDNIIAIMKQFAPPGWEEIKDQILEQKISIRKGVGQLFSLLPSSQKEQIIQFVFDQTTIREGFSDFVRFTNEKKIPLYIVSGGIDFFVYPILEGLVDPEQIYCNGSDFSGETIQISWPYACLEPCTNDCGCCKPTILRKFDPNRYERIVIGDSITDLQAAKLADQVYARDFLIKKCQENGISYTPFTTFYDVIEGLSRKEEVR
ncbi:2-hydroxy-3-keto-5-methylthiopentenyl-1-phosphate phosphatase [Thermoflavimicrobium daqui]|jgi:2-hydroxy-3-keto-5-methylthiopentenyl-1-phosphate phosphatase|uniref:2-hydroxy-3-keto-5-methylthiopentenyl-1-phosphate phosphatase n=1 Tax=Thermoflavimicrobium daqui TaxID=2137476 RepID=A0A364K9K1_9BACL|nr:2-hydroxy-3-keto-5-methylthiopentenyl-1-phosphate phosphatase [Thermoflavimicrobium daqui]RAL26880.1 2-hydroxy-3-keto-5-methylthiopentenyl-1-phosphate phosphatase [Thermoflavimicrobium daqui]